MRRRSRHGLWSLLVRTAYAGCVVLVFSFILFEVLDIDGSDFPRPTSALRANVVDPPHDAKRLTPATGMRLGLDVSPTIVRAPTAGWIRSHVEALSANDSGPLRRSSSTLPRASLDAPPPSA